MATQFKNGIDQAASMMPKPFNLTDNELKALWEQFGSQLINEQTFNDDVENYVQQVAAIKKIPVDDARILVHGALSRPGSQKGSLKGRSVGIYESEEPEPNFDATQWGTTLLEKNPNAWGVLYGYNANGKFHKLKNPIYVKDQQEVNKYQSALGNNGKGGTSAYMAGRYR